jgi:hypothetical protein
MLQETEMTLLRHIMSQGGGKTDSPQNEICMSKRETIQVEKYVLNRDYSLVRK